ARNRAGGDLAVRAREDRPRRGAPLLRHRRALRRRDGAADRPRPRAGRRPRRGGRASRRGAPLGGAGSGPRRERAGAGALVRRGNGPPDRDAPHELGGPGGPEGVPREASAVLAVTVFALCALMPWTGGSPGLAASVGEADGIETAALRPLADGQ